MGRCLGVQPVSDWEGGAGGSEGRGAGGALGVQKGRQGRSKLCTLHSKKPTLKCRFSVLLQLKHFSDEMSSRGCLKEPRDGKQGWGL